MRSKYSKRNHRKLMQNDARLYLLFQRLALELKSGWDKPILEVIKVEVPKEELYKMFHKNICKSMIDSLVDLGYIARVSNSQRNNEYYINPNVSHCMTGAQCEEFVSDKHYDLFTHWASLSTIETMKTHLVNEVNNHVLPGVPPMSALPTPMPLPVPTQMPVPGSPSATD